MSLNTSDILQERYKITALLGQGGMGAVYQAWDMRLDVTVALKEMMLQPELDANLSEQLRLQFKQEAKVLARLNHPHLVRVSDFFEENGNAYLVMDFVEGESLADLILRKGLLPESQVLEWTEQLLDALQYCHSQNVIHRDIKPQNVIINAKGQAILVDFGLVKLWDQQDPRTRTVIQGMGTPEYSPPEQYGTLQQHTDPRSDIYSLGATLYHALTGQAPLTATDRIANPEQFVPVRSINASVSDTTEAVVLKAMALPQSQRFGNAREMTAALRGSPTLVFPVHREDSTVRQPRFSIGHSSRAFILILISGVAAVALIVGGILWKSHERGKVVVPATVTVTETPTWTPSPTIASTSTAEPTLTVTPKPTATTEPTSVPTVSPTPSPFPPTNTPVILPATNTPRCSNPQYFLNEWQLRQELGCPVDALTSDFTYQIFEGGILTWQKLPKPSTIRVFFNDGTWQSFVDPDPNSSPQPYCSEAEQTGGLGPIYSFGILWCENDDLRARLGMPRDREQDGKSNNIQHFQSGTILTIGNAGRFILYSDGSWKPF